jgi:hypothetical protein
MYTCNGNDQITIAKTADTGMTWYWWVAWLRVPITLMPNGCLMHDVEVLVACELN